MLKQLPTTVVDFDARFEIMPDTKDRTKEVAEANPYEAVPRQIVAEWSKY